MKTIVQRPEFSVIIPTLQRSADLYPLVEQCAAHPLVLEVLVINNAMAPLTWDSPKVRVLQQTENIYVNPAWNLGASEARGRYLAIVNDDVRFDDAAFEWARRGLKWYGIVGPDRSNFSTVENGKPKLRPARPSSVIFGFGTFMCLRRENYVQIPEEMRIWGGDDWLVSKQARPPGVILGVQFRTEASVTTGSPEIQAFRLREQEICDRILLPLQGTRWWHRPFRDLEKLRSLRYGAFVRAKR